MTPKYMYSESATIWCSQVSDDDPFYYYVHNGGWYFRKNGATIWVEKTGSTYEVNDWVEITKDEVDNWRWMS